jgi:hypothetical protein
MSFWPKIKCIYVVSKHFSSQNLVLELNFASIFVEYRSFLIQSGIFVSKQQSIEKITKYLNVVQTIFNSLFNFKHKFSSQDPLLE